MSKKPNPITVVVTSDAGMDRLEKDIQRKAKIKAALMKKESLDTIEKEHGVKIVRGLPY